MSEIQDAKWYVVHTYSGHENKVKATIENSVKNRGMEDYTPLWYRRSAPLPHSPSDSGYARTYAFPSP